MTSTEPTPLQPQEEPRYAEMAGRLIRERADLFQLAPRRPPTRVVHAPSLGVSTAAARRRRRGGQLALPLRPRVLDGGDRVSD